MFRKVFFRLVAIVIGIAATLLVLEAALQTASRIVRRAERGAAVAPVEGEFRIACIGESTTYGLWPAQLEEILNERSTGPVIRVINRGVVGIRTDDVAKQIEGWLDEDRPHLVITMLGINDEGNVLVYPHDGSRGWLTEHSRSLALLARLWRSALNTGGPVTDEDVEPRGDGHLDEATRAELDRLEARRPETMKRFRYSEAIEIHRELLAVDPGTPVYHLAFLKGLVVHHDPPERIDEFLADECSVDPAEASVDERLRLIGLWAEQTGDRVAALRLATSVARWGPDPDLEEVLLENATRDPEVAGVAWLRLADFASRMRQRKLARQHLLRAEKALPDDYQWRLLLGDLSFLYEAYDVAAASFHRALTLRPDLPTGHELVVLGRLSNACEQAGDMDAAALYRNQRDDLELGRFREFTRFYYRRVVNSIRARGIPVIAMQYPLLSVKSLRKLLDYRDDVTYLENRENFEAALLQTSYREIFQDNFAGAFGHLSPRGNMLVAENVADALSAWIPETGVSENTTDPTDTQAP